MPRDLDFVPKVTTKFMNFLGNFKYVRQKKRQRGIYANMCGYGAMCGCMCEREIERDREREQEKDTEGPEKERMN